jgi:membrane-bound serine protease (ClpP class)
MNRSRFSVGVVLAIGLVCAGGGAQAGEQGDGGASPSDDWTDKVVLLQIIGEEGIRWDQRNLVKDKVEGVFARVKREPPRQIVVEIDSPGGSVRTCDDLSKLLKACSVPTAALVTHKAVSGGTVIATACNRIVMVKGSRIGDVKPIFMIPGPVPKPADLSDELKEKVERDVITLLESNAEANEHRVEILQAMVTASIELYEIRLSDGARTFLTKKQVQVLEENIEAGRDARSITDKQLVCEAGKLLELTAEKAVYYGLAQQVVENRVTFFADEEIEDRDLVIAEITGEGVDIRSLLDLPAARKLSSLQLLLLGLFLVIGIAGVLTEAHVPGFGIPGAIGIIGFACFFYLLVRAGNAEWYEIGIFVAGISLLVVEIVVIPGFGVPGLLGVLLTLGGLFLAFTPEFGTTYMEEHFWDEMVRFTLLLGGVLVVVAILAYFAVSYGDRLPFVQYFYLTKSLRSGAEVLEEVKAEAAREQPDEQNPVRPDLVGRQGVATTPLRPSGKVRLDRGGLLDVVTEGVLVAAQQRVVVREARMNRIVVAPVETVDESGGSSDPRDT